MTILSIIQVTPGTSATPGAQAITVPSGAQWAFWFDTAWANEDEGTDAVLASLSSNFTGAPFALTQLRWSSDPYYQQIGVGVAKVSSTGSKTVTPVWIRNVEEGPVCTMAFLDGLDDTNCVRAIAVHNGGASDPSSAPVFGTVASIATDIVLAYQGNYGGAPTTPSGCTSLASHGAVNSRYGRLSQVNSPGASTTTVNGESESYSCIGVISLKVAGAAPKSLAVPRRMARMSSHFR